MAGRGSRRGGSGGGRLWLSVLATALAGGAVVADRREKVLRAPAELRTPRAYLPVTFNSTTLPLIRALSRTTPAPPISGVVTRQEMVRGGEAPALGILVSERPDRPRGSGALVWIHGGGYVIGTAAHTTSFSRSVAHDLNVLVVCPDYRLAPENPFPAALDDCFAALLWLRDHSATLGIDPGLIAIGGDSAGGGLAACLAQRAHDAGIALVHQSLAYPMLDDRTCLRHPVPGTGELVWTRASNHFGWSSYLDGEPGVDTPPPYAAAARRADLSGLPPAWIGVGSSDLFHDENVAYARRLREAGVAVELEVVDGLYHGADQLAPWASLSRHFRASQLEALRLALVPAAEGAR